MDLGVLCIGVFRHVAQRVFPRGDDTRGSIRHLETHEEVAFELLKFGALLDPDRDVALILIEGEERVGAFGGKILIIGTLRAEDDRIRRHRAALCSLIDPICRFREVGAVGIGLEIIVPDRFDQIDVELEGVIVVCIKGLGLGPNTVFILVLTAIVKGDRDDVMTCATTFCTIAEERLTARVPADSPTCLTAKAKVIGHDLTLVITAVISLLPTAAVLLDEPIVLDGLSCIRIDHDGSVIGT